MTISVLLPVYEAGPTLAVAIESILRQEYEDLELLVIDDASTDGSAEVIRDYAARDERVRPIFHPRNKGLSATLNEGLTVARGELVARMDQDDESLPARVGVQVGFMEEHPKVVAAGSFVYHMGASPEHDHLIEFPTDPDDIRRTLRRYNCLYHPSVIVRRGEILELGGYRPEFRNAEDYDLWLRASNVHDLGNVPEPLLRYRLSLGGMTFSRKWEQLYYVYLAQAADGGDVTSLERAHEVAARMIAETDKRAFMTEVGRGTVFELLRLRLRHDAMRMLARMAREAGTGAALQLGSEIARPALRRRARDLRAALR